MAVERQNRCSPGQSVALKNMKPSAGRGPQRCHPVGCSLADIGLGLDGNVRVKPGRRRPRRSAKKRSVLVGRDGDPSAGALEARMIGTSALAVRDRISPSREAARCDDRGNA